MNKFLKTKTLTALLLATVVGSSYAQESDETAHLNVENPADLSHAEANEIYDEIRERMAESFALAEISVLEDYQSWTRFNVAPYLSATHGQRFVNNFANDKTIDYGQLPEGGRYPVGTAFAKDSFTVLEDRNVYPGALFAMEKLPEGESPETADWRYMMILPDGTTLGDTTGEKPKLVRYCHACHQRKADQDFVFFVPEDYQTE